MPGAAKQLISVTGHCDKKRLKGSPSVCLDSVFFVEPVDPSSSLCTLLLACVEGMAFTADFHVDAFLCGAGNESVSAVALYCCLKILRMYVFSHLITSNQQCVISDHAPYVTLGYANSLCTISHISLNFKRNFYKLA